MAGGIHDGHRERLKRQFLNNGLPSFESHQVLELLLFYSIPRKDTNPIAHDLLNTFGDLPHVLDASTEELCRVNGISEHSAVLLKLCGELLARYHAEKRSNVTTFSTIEEVGSYMAPLFLNEHREKAVVMCVNNRWDMLNCTTLSTGTITGTQARAREIVELALRHHATGVILAHNHPAGFALPSPPDIQTTKFLVRALGMMDVALHDHLIFSPDDYISMRQSAAFADAFVPDNDSKK